MKNHAWSFEKYNNNGHIWVKIGIIQEIPNEEEGHGEEVEVDLIKWTFCVIIAIAMVILRKIVDWNHIILIVSIMQKKMKIHPLSTLFLCFEKTQK